MLQMLSTFFVGALGAVLTWLAANFFGKPLVDFLKLRKEIQEELTFLSNVDPPRTPYEFSEEIFAEEHKTFDEVQRSIRRLGSKMSAMEMDLRLVLHKPLSWLLREMMRYNIRDATKGLLDLSTRDDEEAIALARYKVEVALRLPHWDESYVKSITESRRRRREERAQRRKKAPEQSG